MGFASIHAVNQRRSDVLFDGAIAVVRITRIAGDKVDAMIFSDGPHGKIGTPYVLTNPIDANLQSVRDLAQGRVNPDDADKNIPASAVGDVVVFERAVADGKSLIVGRIATRVHNNFDGPVQVGRMLFKPTKASVSKRGATQFGTIMDPSKGEIVRSPEALTAFMLRELTVEWPGGRPGVIIRTRDDGSSSIMAEDLGNGEWASPAALARQLIEDNQVLANGGVELTPIWQMPIGRDQIWRDVDVRRMTSEPILGPFARLYVDPKNGFCFFPSVVILGDEDEWAFGAKTGRRQRVVLGAHPLTISSDIQVGNVPTPALSSGKLIEPIKLIYRSASEIEAATVARAARRVSSPASRPVHQAAAGRAPHEFSPDGEADSAPPMFGRR